MHDMLLSVLLGVACAGGVFSQRGPVPDCAEEVRARVEAGWLCGARRRSPAGKIYASYQAVPYARQPLGHLRFKELEPPEAWDGTLYATEEGPVCPQHDVFYGKLMQPRNMSEACIHANIYVPLPAGGSDQPRPARELQPPFPTNYDRAQFKERPEYRKKKTGLPILVFIHGGGFAFGSGDADVYGPERLVDNGVIVITFNYRLNVFGFLSLNSSSVPGNNGLRDVITLLRWVKRNARAFGGDPDDVTLGGQSAGAASAHLLALSPAARGLFKRVILMSGTALPTFYTTSPTYARTISSLFVTSLGINSTDPEEVHRQLVEAPLEKIMAVNRALQDKTGLVVFFPVVESPLDNVTAIIDADPEELIANGRGKDIPMIVGYTNVECESFRPRLQQIDILAMIKANPLLLLSPAVIFSSPVEDALKKASLVEQRYFNGTPTLEKYIESCSDTFYEYPALQVSQYRHETGGAPLYLYQFSFDADYSVLKEAWGLNYAGAGHAEDMTFVFQVNSVPVPHTSWDQQMRHIMTTYVTNFMRYGNPSHGADAEHTWRAVDRTMVPFQYIESPAVYYSAWLTHHQTDLMSFHSTIRGR